MLSPREGTLGKGGAFDFSGKFLVKLPTMGPQNLVKSDQISPPWGTGSNIPYLHSSCCVYILQIIRYKLPSFFIYSFDALCNPRKIINKFSI